MYMYLLYHSLTCTEGCNPVKKNMDAKIKMDCTGNAHMCPQVVWNIEDPKPKKEWPVSLINNSELFGTERSGTAKCCK